MKQQFLNEVENKKQNQRIY